MKHISEYCLNMARRLNIEPSAVQGGYNIDSILKDGDLSRGLVCVAARSGVGKTTFALDLVLGQAVKKGGKILICSCEKSTEQIVAELVMKLCGLNTCFLNANDSEKIEKMSQALGFLSGLNIYIESFEYGATPDLSDIERVIDSVDGLELVLIDGLYCVWDEMKPEKLAMNESKRSIKHLKALCKRNDTAIIITTYFVRTEIKRMLSGDMSGNVLLENGIDLLIALYRSVVGTTISDTADFLVTDPNGRYDRGTLYYDRKNRRFLKN